MNFPVRCTLPLLWLATAVPASAQFSWTVTNLNPAFSFSSARGVNATQQGGAAQNMAALWSGSAGSMINLNPTGASSSSVWAISGAQQVGGGVFSNVVQAGLWTGTAESYVSLHPNSSSGSSAFATTGSQQAGNVAFSGVGHAAVWSGTAESFTDLHPSGYYASSISAMTSSQQGGYVTSSAGFGYNAAIWSGTASSVVNLHPSGYVRSEVLAMSGTQQGGYIVAVDGGFWLNNANAALWSGTAGSFVNLNPSGASTSAIYTMIDGYQFGWANFGASPNTNHAGMWSGTADSFIDLHSTLTAGFGTSFDYSQIHGAYSDGSTLYLVGETDVGAFMMTSPISAIPEPTTYALLGGLLALGTVMWQRVNRRG
jgi:hypothetical protein